MSVMSLIKKIHEDGEVFIVAFTRGRVEMWRGGVR